MDSFLLLPHMIQHPYRKYKITGVRNAKEAYENTAATSWSLTPEEIAIINKAVDALDQEEN